MCARCLKEGMFLPKQKKNKRTKDPNQPTPETSESSNIPLIPGNVPDDNLGNIPGEIGTSIATNEDSSAGFHVSENVPGDIHDSDPTKYDSYYDSGDYYMTTNRFPILIAVAAAMISVAVSVFIRRSVK